MQAVFKKRKHSNFHFSPSSSPPPPPTPPHFPNHRVASQEGDPPAAKNKSCCQTKARAKHTHTHRHTHTHTVCRRANEVSSSP